MEKKECCFTAADILLPAEQVNEQKWAVVACDQYTSEPNYWEETARFVGEEPSTLHLIYPEVYLEEKEGDRRIAGIFQQMKQYLSEGILHKEISNGFVLVERITKSGRRLGLVGKLDLEQYDYTPGTHKPVRATEGTIQSRIPPRVRIREGAVLEVPHVMLLLDDPSCRLMEPLYEKREHYRKVYDTTLMQQGGHLTGYAIEGKEAKRTAALLETMEQESGGFFFAVGDGNHSLATAKTCWNRIKPTLSSEEAEYHPARYAMVEVVNLHSPALLFEPIHRVLFQTKLEQTYQAFTKWAKEHGIEVLEISQKQREADMVWLQGEKELALSIGGLSGHLPVDVLQSFLDVYDSVLLDYVHGEEAVRKLTASGENCGILLSAINKSSLFPAIVAGGVLPRKTFSMGESYEKRYYMECRKIM